MFKLCVTQNYFQYNNKYYFQNSGLPMGSPLSPLMADIFMDNFETKILCSNLSKKHVLFWYRYVDDVIVGFHGTNRQIDKFLNYINDIHPNIKFTVEIENDNNTLNFLDLSIRNINGKFKFNIYRKDTFSDSVISFDSFSPDSHKFSAFNSMVHRALSVPLDEKDLNEELNIIRQIGINNKFSVVSINNIINKHKRKFDLRQVYPVIPDTSKKLFYSIPYLGNISYNVKKKLQNLGIDVSFKPSRNVGSLLFNVKDKTDVLQKCGVYRIDCSDCAASYIGQTGRTFNIRYREHIANNNNTNSNFAKHLLESNHILSQNHSLQILHIEEKGPKLNLLEALEINKLNKNARVILLNDQIDLNNSPLLNINLKT